MPPHFRKVCRGSRTKSLSNLGKNKLWAATHYITGHCELNYYLDHKFKPQIIISKLCHHCSMEEETMNHFIGQSGFTGEDDSSRATTLIVSTSYNW